MPRALKRSLGLRPQVASLNTVRLGDLRCLQPVSREYGFDRGQPIDRYYIAQFLAANALDVTGRVLEIGGDEYTRQFGAGKGHSLGHPECQRGRTEHDLCG